jgi:hypothetical protein
MEMRFWMKKKCGFVSSLWFNRFSCFSVLKSCSVSSQFTWTLFSVDGRPFLRECNNVSLFCSKVFSIRGKRRQLFLHVIGLLRVYDGNENPGPGRPCINASWFYLEYHHRSQWSASLDEVPQRVDPAIGTAKLMFTTIWGVNGFHLLDLTPSQYRFNAQYFMEHVMVPLVQRVFPQGRTRYTPQLNGHLGNCRAYFVKVTE